MKCPDRELTRAAQDRGFSLHRMSSHAVWRHPSGVQVVTSRTPSDHRALRNAIRDMDRALAAALRAA